MEQINADGMHYRELNARVKEMVANGVRHIQLRGVFGQRYIGTGITQPVEVDIFGTPGNDLGAFMKGPRITVYGNAQDGVANTMDEGEIIVHGHAGDIIGYAMRGGKVFIREDVGYRAGIHMKEYKDKRPAIVIGGTAQDFLGEYMAGGVLILLGVNLKEGEAHRANFIGTGMHSGVIYIRGNVRDYQLGKEVGVAQMEEKDQLLLRKLVGEFCHCFSFNANEILKTKFLKLFPLYLRPYGRLYVY